MEQEVKIAGRMIDLYSRGHHGSTENICSECHELFDLSKSVLRNALSKRTNPGTQNAPLHFFKRLTRSERTKRLNPGAEKTSL
jgi:hypothetical protein